MNSSYRWRIMLLVTAAIAISYFDRQTLSVAIKAIQSDIPVTNTQFSQLQAAFLVAYAIMYAGGGKLIDVLGTRRGFLVVMIWWSLACASHGLATAVGFLAVSRFLLGMGEGGGFPAATKAIAEWFPVEERSIAMGFINGGTAVGSVVAPPLIAAVLGMSNWRWVFFLSGSIGLFWSIWWWRDYRSVERSSEPGAPAAAVAAESWIGLLRVGHVWGWVAAKFLSDGAWFFYLFWLPKYLYDVRHFDIKQVGAYGWIPYAASGVGSVLGGWFSSHLIQRGRPVGNSRKWAMAVSVSVMPFVFFVTQTPVQLALVLFSLAFAGHQSWSTTLMIQPTDFYPLRTVGSVAGLIGFGGAMGGVVFNLIAGYLLDHGFGYDVLFAGVSSVHVIAFLIVLATWPGRAGRAGPGETGMLSPVSA